MTLSDLERSKAGRTQRSACVSFIGCNSLCSETNTMMMVTIHINVTGGRQRLVGLAGGFCLVLNADLWYVKLCCGWSFNDVGLYLDETEAINLWPYKLNKSFRKLHGQDNNFCHVCQNHSYL